MGDVKRRFWEKVWKSDRCWHWTAARTGAGYGVLRVRGKLKLAHRLAYEWEYGSIPEGLQIDHLCRNRACVNPEHLEAVTKRENLLRGNTVAARNAAARACKCGRPYDHVQKDGRRRCRTCDNRRQREGYARRSASTMS